MNIELTLDEEKLLSTFRRLDDSGRKELLRHALEQFKADAAITVSCAPAERCKRQRSGERPEMFAEPLFTE